DASAGKKIVHSNTIDGGNTLNWGFPTFSLTMLNQSTRALDILEMITIPTILPTPTGAVAVVPAVAFTGAAAAAHLPLPVTSEAFRDVSGGEIMPELLIQIFENAVGDSLLPAPLVTDSDQDEP
ncbi:MAG: hypothetical protein HY583_01925, partial [Candidatus Omnitrophica bacterium]|nr:hypothetical protein [Candidatus Omnitrophota bacterium]